jgi:hypothetical protein
LAIKIFLITKLGDQKNSIATMDDDQKHLVAKLHDYNFLVITPFFKIFAQGRFGTTQKN